MTHELLPGTIFFCIQLNTQKFFMERMNDLRDLLRHDVQDLYSAEEQIIAALPRMIERANNPALKEALQQHLQITEEQRNRLQRVQQLLGNGRQGGPEEQGGDQGGARPGLMARLFRRRTQGGQQMVCRGMQGLIEEGEHIMSEEMNTEVLDAAIIAAAQKMEHYEICAYGTARAFARELNLGQVAELLEQTLDEEYEADDRLTDLAVGRINEEAEGGARGVRKSGGGRGASKGSSKGASKGVSATGGGRGVSKGASKAASKGSSQGGGVRGGTSAGGRGTSKGAVKAASKGGRSSGSKGGSKSGGGRGSKAPSKAAAAKGGRSPGGSRGASSKGRRR